MILFTSDYTEGAHPRIIEKLAETNMEQTVGYGEDPYCEEAREAIKKVCEAPEADVHFLVGGTQTNVTVISAALRHYQGVITAVTGHINVHETGALESCGHKCLTIETADGKLTAEQIAAYTDAHYADASFEHTVQPKMVYISNPTEIGTIYKKAELEAIYDVCKERGLYLFLDGARLGYGLTCRENDLTMADIAANTDVFYIGGTKVGALFGEAVVITNPELKKDFRYSIKQRGGMLAKGRLLGIQDKFLSKLCETVIEGSKDGYPELEEKKEFITKVISEEEEKFNKTIDQGLSILADMEKALEEQNKNVLSGEDTFKLYDTYGFPIDLTKEILEEKNITIDEEGFSKCMNEQREKARKARKVSNYMGADATVYDEIDPAITSEFVGYDKLKNDSKVTVLTTEEDVVEALSEGDKGTIIVDETVFYATMGGQEGDKGYITSPEGEFKVDTTIKLKGGKIGHVGVMTKGMIKAGDTVTLLVDSEYRADTCKNHSATHLLQKALRMVLGNHVEQKGSYVDPERLRFDFTHFQSMTAEELKKVEDIVNEKIVEAIPVETKIMTIEEAKKTGAMALFGEKYGESVRVVCIDDFSKEFCGGTHVANTANIRLFKIISEAGVAAGVRRIEALTDKGVLKYYEELEKLVKEASEAAKTESVQLVRRIHTMNDEIKALSSENEKLKAELANNALGDVSDNVVEIKGVKFVATKVDNVDMNELRNLGDKIKNEIGSGVVLVVSAIGSDKVNMIAMATDDAVAKGAHAGNLIKAVASLVGGGGGGRPNMAQAGGKNPAGIPELLKKAPNVLEEQL